MLKQLLCVCFLLQMDFSLSDNFESTGESNLQNFSSRKLQIFVFWDFYMLCLNPAINQKQDPQNRKETKHTVMS